ncbi:MAG TPA: PAS domain-containing sensor histidine kinase, partial [Kofleriaceae bacterium]|nr:PAS domain-containing sensor histidine kinase [Kofleriaceae bacterium]
DAWQGLLALVSRTYVDADQDRYTLERSIEISSREMQGLYQDLKRRTDSELALQRHRIVESLAMMHAMLESATEGILVVDRDRSIVAANRRMHELLRVPTDMTGMTYARFIDLSCRWFVDPAGARARVEALQEGAEIVDDEIVCIDGRRLERHSAPVTLPDGELVGRVTFIRDVTAQRHAHAQLDRAREAAEAASHAKTMFLANMSHELRTPLNSVIGLADLMLLDATFSARQREFLDGIAQSGRHLLALVNDVLDLAKIEAGKDDLLIERVGMREAVDEACSALMPLAHHRGVTLSCEIADDADMCADPLRLRQILYNLISNAVKFTQPAGAVRISTDVEDARVAIAVADTGVGISEADLSRLYRAFEQLKLASGDRPQGTGLGLAVTKRLVDMHGGTIDVVSKLGVGTTFTVRIPRWL